MTIGPLSYLVLAFPGNQFTGEIIPQLEQVVDRGLIHIIDLIFILKDQDGNVEGVELAAFDEVISGALAPLVADVRGLLSHDDVARVGADLENNSSAALLLFEHRWAVDLQATIEHAGGRIVDQGPVSEADLAATLAEVAALQAS